MNREDELDISWKYASTRSLLDLYSSSFEKTSYEIQYLKTTEGWYWITLHANSNVGIGICKFNRVKLNL